MVDAKIVAQLREATGAGMMDAKKALEETNGDIAAATEILQKKGLLKAGKKADRETKEGKVHCYIHGNGKIGAMVEVLCETDFVARTDAFVELCNDLALHVSASSPLYVSRADVPEDESNKQKEMFREEAAATAKSPEILEKIVEGKMDKWFSDIALLEQPFVKDEDMSVEEMLKGKIATLGENILVRRIARFQIG